MSALNRYRALRQSWEKMYSKEPEAWGLERSQYISLLQEGRVEEFFLLVCDNLALFSSLFVLEDGFLIFEAYAKPRTIVLRELCSYLLRMQNHSEDLSCFWEEGLFDRIVFQVLGTAEDCTLLEQRALVQASLRVVSVQNGAFLMGALPNDRDAKRREKPLHRVRLTQSFEMGRYLCTQALYEHVMGANPSVSKGGGRPTEWVSWCDAILFCNKFSVLEGLEPVYAVPKDLEEEVQSQTSDESVVVDKLSQKVHWNRQANGYRLPTEAEWEYAAKAGERYIYSGSDNAEKVAWSKSYSDEKTHPVAQKQSNAWGLYDMSGNVFEWVWDTASVREDWSFRKTSLYSKSACVDPMNDTPRPTRVVRGGSWHFFESLARVSCRLSFSASFRLRFLGFRFLKNQD